VFDLLTQLVDKSLVQVEKREGEERYRLLETIRQYARDRLVDAGESEAVRNRHFDWFLELAERVEPELIGPEQVAWLDRLETDHDNFRAALAWGLDGRSAILGLRLVAALWRLWHVRDRQTEGLDWLRRALTAPGAQVATTARAKALQGVVELTLFAVGGSSAEQARAAEESLTICQDVGDRTGSAWSMDMVGRYAISQGDYARAESLLEHAIALAREVKARWAMAQVLEGLGYLALVRGNLLDAQQRFGESLTLFRDLGDRRAIASSCSWIGYNAVLLGDYAVARARFGEALSISRELHSQSWYGFALLQLAAMARIEGSYEQSRRSIEEALAIARDIGARWLHGSGLAAAGWLARAERDNERAKALTAAALRLFNAAVFSRGIDGCLRNLGILAVEAGRVRRGACLLGASDRMGDLDRVIYGLLLGNHEAYLAYRATARTMLGDREFEAAWAEGQAMTLDQAVAYALEEIC
jgi:non-specific serine/threonine protein kinase